MSHQITIPDEPEELRRLLVRLSSEDQLAMLVMANQADRPPAFVRLQEACQHDWQQDGQTYTSVRITCTRCLLSKLI